MSRLCLILFLQSIVFISFGQIADTAWIQKSFNSKFFEGKRKITVQLPPQYLENPTDSFMITYLLDAQGPRYFNMQVRNLDYLSSRNGIIPTILVGIHTDDRFKEFTPFARPNPKRPKDADFKSQLTILQDHIRHEVMPWIKENFRTKSFNAIIGHSKAAHFVLHTLFDGNQDLFDAYLAISPAIGFDDFYTVVLVEKRLNAGLPLNKFLYCSSGKVGASEQFFEESVDMIDEVIKKYDNSSLTFIKRKFSGKDHFTTVAPSVVEGMVQLKNKHMLSVENIEKFMIKNQPLSSQMDLFINNLKNSNSFYYSPSNNYYTRIAGDFFEEEDFKIASELYLWSEKNGNIEKWWELVNAGTSLCKIGNKTKGKIFFDQALPLLEKNKDTYGENYQKILADVQRQIQEGMQD